MEPQSKLDNNDYVVLKANMIAVLDSKNDEKIKEMRILIEKNFDDIEWYLNVLLPITASKEFEKKDFSQIIYNVPYKIIDLIADNYNLYETMTKNNFVKPIIKIITNIIESDNCSLNIIMSMVDYLNILQTFDEAKEVILKLLLHIINEVFIGGIKRLKEKNFVCSELLKVIIISYLKLFIKISKFVRDPLFFLKRIVVFSRDFIPPQHTLENEEEADVIGKLLLMYLYKSVEIFLTCKHSVELLSDSNRRVFKDIASRIYQLSLSYDVEFEEELENISTNVTEFKNYVIKNCKAKKADEAQEYMYHLAITQDNEIEKKKLSLAYVTLLYIYITNYSVAENDAATIPIETLLVSYFKINAFHTANEYNDPFIVNGVLEMKIRESNFSSIDLPEILVTQVLQQLAFEGERSISTIKKILSMMDYKYQMWYILDTIADCPLDEARVNMWKFILPVFVKLDDNNTWIQLCNLADIEILNYTDDTDKNSESGGDELDFITDKFGKKQVINSMLAFMSKYKKLTKFVQGLEELLEIYESLDPEAADYDENKDRRDAEGGPAQLSALATDNKLIVEVEKNSS
ncbi:hypothetical protein QEN19_000252 [Hanseniaspora menglaensis]